MSRTTRFLSTANVALLAAGLSSAAAFASDSGCEPEFEALSKMATTPTHSFTTRTAALRGGSKPLTSEEIQAGGSIYFKVNEKWIRSALTPQEELRQEQENGKNNKATCRYLREELVNGEAAAVYSIHGETEDAKSDTQLWISKSKGLLLRQEIDLDVGGQLGKSHSSTRYEYNNVQAPEL
jgi:hypothetical protein